MVYAIFSWTIERRSMMKAIALSLSPALVWLLVGCTYLYTDSSPELLEAETVQMDGCRKLGVISDTADAGNVSAYDAAYRMIANIKTRALRMGATHIVWLRKSELSATAVAYQCPSR
jgi:hypothetical protein